MLKSLEKSQGKPKGAEKKERRLERQKRIGECGEGKGERVVGEQGDGRRARMGQGGSR